MGWDWRGLHFWGGHFRGFCRGLYLRFCECQSKTLRLTLVHPILNIIHNSRWGFCSCLSRWRLTAGRLAVNGGLGDREVGGLGALLGELAFLG